jgi:peptide-methionine (S)-S-oxide reductase
MSQNSLNTNVDLQSWVLGAGCFWGVELYFSKLDGVLATSVGYCGGITENPTYEEVCRKDTQHAEVVKVDFDTNVISAEQLLIHFFEMHDPTTLNRQGPDVGTQYRSVIFYANEGEKVLAENVLKCAQKNYDASIVTTLEPLKTYWIAEDYHQQYLQKRGYR